jgi:hypothetical protein
MPINVPDELSLPNFTQRHLFNGDEKNVNDLNGSWFIKSNDKIKSYAEPYFQDKEDKLPILSKGNYQYSEYIQIDSEWRAFVFEGKLLGLQNYSGDFLKFPDAKQITSMIENYKSAPISYTLDVGVNDKGTFIIECHSFFSCGLYGFNNILIPKMYMKWFEELLKNKNFEELLKNKK